MVHFSLFFFNDTATTEIYTLSLHDALPILTITTAGSRGDVQPYVALGLGLKEAGHEVRLATYTPFEGFVRGHGLGYHPITGDPGGIVADLIESGLNPVKFTRTFQIGRASCRERV